MEMRTRDCWLHSQQYRFSSFLRSNWRNRHFGPHSRKGWENRGDLQVVLEQLLEKSVFWIVSGDKLLGVRAMEW